jgi:hypothetical protein
VGAATLTGIPGITPAMVPVAGVAVTDPAGGMITIGIMARVCVWAAGRADLARNASSTGSSIVMDRVARVTVVAVRVMHRVHRLMNRVAGMSIRATRVVVRVTAGAGRVMHQARRLMNRAARGDTRVIRAVVRVMVVVLRALPHTIARAGASESTSAGVVLHRLVKSHAGRNPALCRQFRTRHELAAAMPARRNTLNDPNPDGVTGALSGDSDE